MKKIESILIKNGLKRVSYLEEVLSEKFIIDSNYANNPEKQVPIYPVTKKRNLTHNLLNLYGTHWRYIVNPSNWEKIEKIEGDSEIVLKNIKEKKAIKRNAKYAFTQKYLNEFKSLWIFIPETKAHRHYQNVLIGKYDSDMQEYKIKKRIAKQK